MEVQHTDTLQDLRQRIRDRHRRLKISAPHMSRTCQTTRLQRRNLDVTKDPEWQVAEHNSPKSCKISNQCTSSTRIVPRHNRMQEHLNIAFYNKHQDNSTNDNANERPPQLNEAAWLIISSCSSRISPSLSQRP